MNEPLCTPGHLDPYEISDTWLKIHPKECYRTYLKDCVWVNDGLSIMWISFYKKVPYKLTLSFTNPYHREEPQREAQHWMYPGKIYSKKMPLFFHSDLVEQEV